MSFYMLKEHSVRMLRQDLEALGIKSGDTVLMHSSFRSLGGIEDGADGFYRGFLDLLGRYGTLAVPTLTYNSVYETKLFDVLNTPGCVGWLSEFFRTKTEGVIRSLHPTHSCAARGYNAAFLTADNERDITPCGSNSAFRKLPLLGGKILMLGCTLAPCTSMHGVEETVDSPYVFADMPPVDYRVIDKNGAEHLMPVYRHGFSFYRYEQRYTRIDQVLKSPELVKGRILDADAYLIDAAALWKKCRLKMMEEPYFFVEKVKTI
jgi:aminoglycoside 3-N-acetyltransferase